MFILLHHISQVPLPRTITLTSILIKLWPFYFSDREFEVKVRLQALKIYTIIITTLSICSTSYARFVCQVPSRCFVFCILIKLFPFLDFDFYRHDCQVGFLSTKTILHCVHTDLKCYGKSSLT